MTGSGYRIASLDDDAWTDRPGSPSRSPLTEALGCRHTTVSGYRFRGGESLELPTEYEHVCIPTEELDLNETVTLPPDGVGRVPAGVTGSISCDGAASLLVVGASVSETPTPDAEPRALSLTDCSFTPPSTSDIATARLTRPLGCRGMKVNARLLEPDDVVPYHTEGDQEELFVPISGPAAMRIADTTHETPPGTVTRVAPDVPRSALNTGESDAFWVMIGAPPTGGPEEWDPGAKILE